MSTALALLGLTLATCGGVVLWSAVQWLAAPRRLNQARNAAREGAVQCTLLLVWKAFHVPLRSRWTWAQARHGDACLELFERVVSWSGADVGPMTASAREALQAVAASGGRVRRDLALTAKELIRHAAANPPASG